MIRLLLAAALMVVPQSMLAQGPPAGLPGPGLGQQMAANGRNFGQQVAARARGFGLRMGQQGMNFGFQAAGQGIGFGQQAANGALGNLPQQPAARGRGPQAGRQPMRAIPMFPNAANHSRSRGTSPLRTLIYVQQVSPYSVSITSSRDISNVAVQYYDGEYQRFEDLSGRRLRISGTGPYAGKPIQTVWVKSGPNFSGDGPGFGQRFDLRVSEASVSRYQTLSQAR